MLPKSESIISTELIRNSGMPFSMETAVVILYVLKGHFTVHVSNKSQVLREGDLMALSPMQVYLLEEGKNCALLKLCVDARILYLAGINTAYILDCVISAKENGKYAERIRQLLAALFRISVNHGTESELRTPALELISLLYKEYQIDSHGVAGFRIRNLELVNLALTEIRNKWKQPLSLKDIAASQYVSESYFSRVFRKYTGFSFHDCLTEVRLGHAMDDLRFSEKSITETAMENGFSSTNAFITFFRKKYDITPGIYRKQIHAKDIGSGREAEPAEQDGLLEILLEHDAGSFVQSYTRNLQISVPVDVGKVFRHSWKEILNAGYAHDVLLAPIQEQIRRAQKEIGFHFCRVKGVLDDDMYLFSTGNNGKEQPSFLYLDQLTDFILTEGMVPFIEFSWMPSHLARKKWQFFDRCSVISPPTDYNRYENLIYTIILHWSNRYGSDCVSGWRFAVPMFNSVVLWPDIWSYEEYKNLYLSARNAVKSVNKAYQIGGFGFYSDVIFQRETGLRFLRELRDIGSLPDYLTVQCYSLDSTIMDTDFFQYTIDQTQMPSTISEDTEYTAHFLERLHRLMEKENIENLPVIVEEWTHTLWQRDISGDTLFRASWLCKNILQSNQDADALGYWLLTDWMSEHIDYKSAFHGGYGLINHYGVAKAGYRLLQILNRTGTHYLKSGEGWYVTRDGQTIQVIFYHYCHYEEIYRLRYKRLSDPYQAYEVFQNSGRMHIELSLTGLQPGTYRIRKYILSRDSGSSFDEWLKIGAPEELTQEQAKWLDQVSIPGIHQTKQEVTRELKLTEDLEPHEVYFIEILPIMQG